MHVQFVYGAKGGAFRSAIQAEAVNRGFALTISHPFIGFDVADWHDFLSIVWAAACECSRDERGQEFVNRIPVSVEINGRTYYTQVWVDVAQKCLRYASL